MAQKEPVKELKKIERVLKDIKENTEGGAWSSFSRGILYGVGIVVGTLVGATLLGWVLSLFGVIPGFDEIAGRLSTTLKDTY